METPELDLSKFPTPAHCIMAVKGWESTIERLERSIEQRADNYYNCMDDYSMGGICDKAADQGISDCRQFIRIIQDQMKRGEPYVDTFLRLVLCYQSSGRVASEKTVQTRYGSCWVIERPGQSAVFVSQFKSPSAYLKKGYKLMCVVETVEYYYTVREYNRQLITQSVILSSHMRKPTAGDLQQAATRKAQVVYFAQNAQQPINSQLP